MKHQLVVILDFGEQFNQLMARRIRECGVYCEVKPGTTTAAQLKAMDPIGIIFSDSPYSVCAPSAPQADLEIFSLGVPILGIGYGCQLLARNLGGEAAPAQNSSSAEYGKAETRYDTSFRLFRGVAPHGASWIRRSNCISRLPDGFTAAAHTPGCPYAAFADEARGFYGLQFRPEVNHTENGADMIRNFLVDICGARCDWTMADYLRTQVSAIREKVGSGKVLLALSGGVDSSVTAALLAKAVGSQLTCIFVDTGLMRKNEGDEVEAAFSKRDLNFIRVNAEPRFLSRLAGVTEPERKRKIIGEEFIRVFEEEGKKIGRVDYLAQGTIYPDVIESGSGSAAVIKSHHNVGGLPDYVDFKEIIEPLRPLFKGEVRSLGRELGLPDYLVMRQPFPGPGLSIRCIGEVTKVKLDILRDADAIFREEIRNAGMQYDINQYFAILTNMRSVGITGEDRTYDYTLALRGVITTDFMTADWARIPYDLLERISQRIVSEVGSINRVVYDITSKPPATIEWE